MNYLKWHFFIMPRRLLKITDNFLRFFTHYFSIPLLVKTYFSPWHKIIEAKTERALNIEKTINRIIGNLFSSFIGIILRTFVFIIWLFLEIQTAIIGIILAIIWLLFPLATLPLYFEYKNKLYAEKTPSHFWHKENLLSIPSPTASWHFGYTPNLDKFSKELTEKIYIAKDKIIGRDYELKQVTQILSRKTQPALILYGPAGSGRHAVVYELSRQIKTDCQKIPPELKYNRIIKIDTIRLLKQAFQLQTVLSEAEKAGNIILVLDEMHKLISFFDQLAPYLQRGSIKLIGLATSKNYTAHLQKNELAKKLFEFVKVNPLAQNYVLELLKNEAEKLKKKYKVVFTEESLQRIMQIANQSAKTQPDASLDLIEETALAGARGGGAVITPQYINKLAEEKLKIPLSALGPREKQKLANIEQLLHQYVVNQNTAISELASALRRARLRLESPNRPLASFLFLGPTGVGKTETAKALNRVYFQDLNSQFSNFNSQFIRFDLSNYQNKSDTNRFTAELADKVREIPYSVLLLDEIEKSHPDILNLFLTVIDEGYLTDLDGDEVSFRNLFIIGTSNAPSVNIFSKEFLNRFDGIIMFSTLDKHHLAQIARMKLEQLNQRLKKEHNTKVDITEGLIGTIIEEGYNPEFGAREINRAIARIVENPLAKKLLEQ